MTTRRDHLPAAATRAQLRGVAANHPPSWRTTLADGVRELNARIAQLTPDSRSGYGPSGRQSFTELQRAVEAESDPFIALDKVASIGTATGATGWLEGGKG